MTSHNAYDLTYRTGISNLKLEKAISKDCHYSCYYSYYVIKGRFELGEEAISKDGYYSYFYAMDVLKSRFRLAEKRNSSKLFLFL